MSSQTMGPFFCAPLALGVSFGAVAAAVGPFMAFPFLPFPGEPDPNCTGGKPGDGKAADRLQAVVAAMIDEILGSEDGAAEPAGEFLKPRRQVYRRTDASEIQPVAAADIAEQHVADMQ